MGLTKRLIWKWPLLVLKSVDRSERVANRYLNHTKHDPEIFLTLRRLNNVRQTMVG